jgi:hypothetical protein
MHFRVHGKRAKIRYLPAHSAPQRLIEDYRLVAGPGADKDGPLFRPVRNNRSPEGLNRALGPASIHRNIVRKYDLVTGMDTEVTASACTPCGLRRRPMRSIMVRTSPRCRSG